MVNMNLISLIVQNLVLNELFSKSRRILNKRLLMAFRKIIAKYKTIETVFNAQDGIQIKYKNTRSNKILKYPFHITSFFNNDSLLFLASLEKLSIYSTNLKEKQFKLEYAYKPVSGQKVTSISIIDHQTCLVDDTDICHFINFKKNITLLAFANSTFIYDYAQPYLFILQANILTKYNSDCIYNVEYIHLPMNTSGMTNFRILNDLICFWNSSTIEFCSISKCSLLYFKYLKPPTTNILMFDNQAVFGNEMGLTVISVDNQIKKFECKDSITKATIKGLILTDSYVVVNFGLIIRFLNKFDLNSCIKELYTNFTHMFYFRRNLFVYSTSDGKGLECIDLDCLELMPTFRYSDKIQNVYLIRDTYLVITNKKNAFVYNAYSMRILKSFQCATSQISVNKKYLVYAKSNKVTYFKFTTKELYTIEEKRKIKLGNITANDITYFTNKFYKGIFMNVFHITDKTFIRRMFHDIYFDGIIISNEKYLIDKLGSNVKNIRSGQTRHFGVEISSNVVLKRNLLVSRDLEGFTFVDLKSNKFEKCKEIETYIGKLKFFSPKYLLRLIMQLKESFYSNKVKFIKY
jgi:hypothetical protein